jgi:hypothetical protein
VLMSFRHLTEFVGRWNAMKFTDLDLSALERQLMERPEAGVVMAGTGGIRKVRFAPPSRHGGKSGATRVCYVVMLDRVCYLLTIFPKNEKANLTVAERRHLSKVVAALRKHHQRPDKKGERT